MKIGICSNELLQNKIPINEHHYELRELYHKFSDNFFETLLIDVSELSFEFNREDERLGVFLLGEDISNLDLLIVRRTKGIEAQVAVLAKSLENNGAVIIDGIERFTGAPPSKLISTIKRFEKGIGSSSYFALSIESAFELLEKIVFPIITKPLGGKQGDDVFLLSTKEDYLEHVHSFFDTESSSIENILFFQKYMKFKTEYRAFVVGGECLGLAKKVAVKNMLVPNAAKGGKFKKEENDAIKYFVEDNCDSSSILGVDVAIDHEDKFHIIEANYSPQWKEFEKATGINIAQSIVSYGLRRLQK